MSIAYPKKRSLGAEINNFPEVQYAKIKEIIDTVNALTTSITTATLTVSGTATIGTVSATTVTGTTITGTNITASTSLTTNALFFGTQAISGPGALSLTKPLSVITTTGADAFTLANGSADGQVKMIVLAVDGGDATITPTNLAGFTTITLNDAGDGVTLVWSTSNTNWFVVGNNGATLA